MKCEWCNEDIEVPAKAHTMPPCKAAPERWKRKWEKGKAERDKIDESFKIIYRMTSRT